MDNGDDDWFCLWISNGVAFMTEEQERILRLKKKQWVIIIRPFIRPRGEDRTLVLSEKWNKDAGQPVHWEDLELAPHHTDEEYDVLFNRCQELASRCVNDPCRICDPDGMQEIIDKQMARIKELEAQLHARGCLTCDRFMVGWLSEECSKGCHAPDWNFWVARK